MGQIDILSVGDVVTDAFIKLLDDQAEVVEENGTKWLAMPFATKLPFDHVEIAQAVGNASNAAVAFARLGLNTGFMTNVGGDQEGRDIITTLHHEKVDTRFIRINPSKKSNYHYVLWYKDERTILIKHEEYDYHWPHLRPTEVPRWIYFSSISERALEYHDQVSDWLDENPGVRMAFQPGTFQMKAGTERLKRIYQRTEVLVLNRQEAALVSGGVVDNIPDLFDRLHALGPNVVIITDGPDGAYASDGQHRYSMPLYPDPSPPKERTGAGDAFASTLVAALVKGLSLEEALQWAPINSMSVVQSVGAQTGLLKEKALLEWLHHAPRDYHVKPL
ncbi:MAG: carbohydrate kinase family protein [Candidatus Saccharimonadales bacterium]